MHTTGGIILGTVALMFVVILILTAFFIAIEKTFYDTDGKDGGPNNGKSGKKTGSEKGTEEFH